jgi:Indoleamine 2,3-dioxygenase
MLSKVDIDMAEFGVSPRHGFLPEELPLRRLSDSYYSSWEDIMDQLPSLLKRKALRSHVDQLSVLSTAHLLSLREWQRAYQVLSFLTHGYIWNSAEGGGPSEVNTNLRIRSGCHLTIIASATSDFCSFPRNSIIPWITTYSHILRAQPLEFRGLISRQ